MVGPAHGAFARAREAVGGIAEHLGLPLGEVAGAMRAESPKTVESRSVGMPVVAAVVNVLDCGALGAHALAFLHVVKGAAIRPQHTLG